MQCFCSECAPAQADAVLVAGWLLADFIMTSEPYDDTERGYGAPIDGTWYMHSEGALPSSNAWESVTNTFADSIQLSYIGNNGDRFFCDYSCVCVRVGCDTERVGFVTQKCPVPADCIFVGCSDALRECVRCCACDRLPPDKTQPLTLPVLGPSTTATLSPLPLRGAGPAARARTTTI